MGCFGPVRDTKQGMHLCHLYVVNKVYHVSTKGSNGAEYLTPV